VVSEDSYFALLIGLLRKHLFLPSLLSITQLGILTNGGLNYKFGTNETRL
jgi:hypothetical protein